MADNTLKRFFGKVDKTESCWLWTGSVDHRGYGRFYFRGRNYLAHRAAHELLIGPISEGLTIDHLCRVKTCVNPDHLEPVTLLENMLRVPRKPKPPKVPKPLAKRCGKGHEFTPENTGYRLRTTGSKRSFRYCITCKRQYMAEYFARRRAA